MISTLQWILYIVLILALTSDSFRTIPHKLSVSVNSRLSTLEFHKTLKYNTRLNLEASDFSMQMYDAQLWFSNFVENNLVSPSLLSFFLLFAAGLLTSFSPCVLGLLPITLAYLGIDSEEYSSEISALGSTISTNQVSKSTFKLLKVISYSFGMCLAFSFFGLSAAFLGLAINPSSTIGAIFGIFIAGLTIVMGLNLLELLQFNFPDLSNLFQSSNSDDLKEKSVTSSMIESLLFGMSSALISSPCSSPVLASLVAVIGSSGKPVMGASYLFTYSLGYVAPVISAGVLSSSINSIISNGKDTSWVNELFASILITFGTYKLLENISSFLN